VPNVLRIEPVGNTVILNLNRPKKRNALSRQLIDELHGALQATVDDARRSVIVLAGAGTSFSAGLDLSEVAAAMDEPEPAKAYVEALFDLFEAIECASKPIIAAVNGAATAGGAALAGVCDLVIAARSAQFGYPQVRHGLAAAIVVPPLIRQVGERRAKRLLLTGTMIDAQTAKHIGLVDEVVDDDALHDRALEVATELGALPQASIARTKAFVREGAIAESAGGDDWRRRYSSRVEISDEGRGFLRRFRRRGNRDDG
jgi:enoyl-CoA hydratase/carnithine racemase